MAIVRSAPPAQPLTSPVARALAHVLLQMALARLPDSSAGGRVA